MFLDGEEKNVQDEYDRELAKQRKKIKSLLAAIFVVPLIFAEAALMMWLVDLLHGWSDRIPTIGYTRAVRIVCLLGLWGTLRELVREIRR